ncbi:MAG: SDR family NAD(P)-dependent oxidoreductase [Caldilineaceae bacterium]
MMDIPGKVVIITGASMGIGEATARVFAAAGAQLVLAARSVDKLEAIAQSLSPQAKTLIVPTDMTSQAQVKDLIDTAYARTDFGKNALRTETGGPSRSPTGNRPMPKPDSAEDVARKILQAAINEPTEMGMED